MSEPESNTQTRLRTARRTRNWWRFWNATRQGIRRLIRRPRTVAESPNLLPLLIQVLAGFSKIDVELLEEEIDSSLGFLRYDYPEAVYSDLKKHFRKALDEHQDLGEMAEKLSTQLGPDQKILLCVQLYDLIARAGLKQEQVIAYYSFMSRLGMAVQAIDIVYQLNASEKDEDQGVYLDRISPLETISFGPDATAEVILRGLHEDGRLKAFRYHDLILLKNLGARDIVVRGRPLRPGTFCRVYAGQRIIIGEQVFTQQDLVAWFNARKNVSIPEVFLKLAGPDEIVLERSRSRDSVLEVRFGLKVGIRALKPVEVSVNGSALVVGERVECALEDRLEFRGGTELALGDLRRRTRAMGGRFALNTTKSEYLVSNNPALLHEDDILLSPGTSGEVLLKITCDYDHKVGSVEVLQADRPILVGDHPVRNRAALADGDMIRIDTGQVLHCDFTERIIEERRNIIRTLDVDGLSVFFRGGATALDAISFSLTRGEMVCVMGASGSGKSTLLRALAGQIQPSHGEVRLNGLSLYDHLENLKGYVSHIPQEDAFDEHLTIGENLEMAAAIRAPHLGRVDRRRRIDGKLIELGLGERRDSIVGSPVRKILSGGERKRLNIGLDMIGSADIYLFDEPTSGLSSKDSEHVVEIIRAMSHNKIVLVTIHQPSSKIFQMFHKAALLDKGGRLVFFGTPSEMLAYFAAAEHEQHFGTELGGCPACGTTRPEFIFDVLETPLRDLGGDIIYEENNRSQLVPARRYSPDFWRDKYEAHRLLQDVRQVQLKKEAPEPQPPTPIRAPHPLRWHDEWVRFRALLKRAFMSKLRNRANLLTTMVEAPVLAVLIAAVLRYSESGEYTFASAFHIPTYLFLGLVVGMFLGLTNSADDIIRDRTVLQRERNLDIRLGYYITAKFLTLALFAAIQCLLFVLIGNWILQVRGMFWPHFGYLFATALSGVSIGLLVSSLVPDGKTAVNIVPLILIPQIILGGALIKYEEMNRNLDFVHNLNRWFSNHPEGQVPLQSDLVVPWICEFMPMRWSYEALVVAQAKSNPLTRRQEWLGKAITAQASLVKTTPKDTQAASRLEELKETLAILSGLEADTPGEVDRRLREIDRHIHQQAASPPVPLRARSTTRVSADQLYVNQKTVDLVSKAEMEQMDYSRQGPINVFFGPVKRVFGIPINLPLLNPAVLVVSSLLMLYMLYFSLRTKLRLRVL